MPLLSEATVRPCRFALPLIHFIPCLLTYSVPLFLKRQRGGTLGGGPGHPPHPSAPKEAARAARAVAALRVLSAEVIYGIGYYIVDSRKTEPYTPTP